MPNGATALRLEALVDPAIRLGEGDTPLVQLTHPSLDVSAKLESLNPTGSYKDRGAAALISRLGAAGVRRILEDSSGNAGAAVATYAARAGLICRILAPAHASPAKLAQIVATGAELLRVAGTRQQVAEEAERQAASGEAVYASHNFDPSFLLGVATIVAELTAGAGRLDAIVAPLGNGGLIEALAWGLGWAGPTPGAAEQGRPAGRRPAPPDPERARPRLIGVQAKNCSPLWDDWLGRPRRRASFTLAEGVASERPVRGARALRAIGASGGGVVAVEEGAIEPAVRALAGQGVHVEPTAALSWAGLQEALEAGMLAPGERVAIVITGHGLKRPTA